MTESIVDIERRWLILTSLGSTLATFVFFILAPVFGYPIEFSDSLGIVQVIVPVFMGYLGTAAQFVFASATPVEVEPHASARPLLTLLVRGPVIVFAIVISIAIAAFGISNSSSAVPGAGMSVSLLSAIITAALALLAVTTNAAVAYLFVAKK